MKTPRLYVRDLSKWAKSHWVYQPEPMASKPLPKSLKLLQRFFRAGRVNLGMEKYYHYLQAFGFGQPTGIDLPRGGGVLVPQGRAKRSTWPPCPWGRPMPSPPAAL